MQSVKEIEFQYVTNQAGEKTAVLLSISAFEELLEDLHDLAIVAERRNEETIPHENLKRELKDAGLLQNSSLILNKLPLASASG